MKLRIKGNSIRLRLTKSEVEQLPNTKYIEEKTSFGKKTFFYALESKASIDKLSASFEDEKITVFIPESFVKDWAGNDIVGIDSNLNINDDALHILVEKDFKCLNETFEDQSDNFENPNADCGSE